MLKYSKLIGKRNEYGYSQDEMAKMLGISKGNYFEKENGKKEFKTSDINKILSIFPEETYESIFLPKCVAQKSDSKKKE